jgi:Flp pilus assembly protein protease CpaA
MELLFVVIFAGILVALVQDIKRREVDNWLTTLLFIFGLSFVIFEAIFNQEWNILIQGFIAVALGFVLMNLFYYGRVFGGGDAKLLFAMSPFFAGITFWGTVINMSVFILFLFFAGALYGLSYILVVYVLHFKEINKDFRKRFLFHDYKWYYFSGLILLLFSTLGGVFFFIVGTLIVLFPELYVFSKAIEDIVMIKALPGSRLREGDWLAEDEKIGRKIVRSHWEGLSLEEVEMLSKKKSVKIKDGIPFLPAFLIAYILYYYLLGYVLMLF